MVKKHEKDAENALLTSENMSSQTRITRSFLDQQMPLKAFIYRIIKRPQDVDDIAQETFIRALKAEKRNNIEHPKAYIYRIARNLAYEIMSKKHIQLTEYIEDCSADKLPIQDNFEEVSATSERMRRVRLAIADLPPQCQRVFIMNKIYGFKYREIASQLGISMSTVEKHIIAGLRKCRHSVAEQETPNSVVPMIANNKRKSEIKE